MTEIAFGKPMDLDWQEDNGNVTLAEDPNCRGRKQIETNAEEFRRQQNNEIKSIMTDMQTILRSFDSAHIEELTRRNRTIVKQELRQNAIAIRKIQQYDEMVRMGITAENAGEVKEKADKSDSMQRVMESLWPGMWDAVQTIVNPRLDKYVMNSGADVFGCWEKDNIEES